MIRPLRTETLADKILIVSFPVSLLFSPLPRLQTAETDLANLLDDYLAALYPNYFEAARPVLLEQARDLLRCSFRADLLRFEADFLSPAAKVIELVKNVSSNLLVSGSNKFHCFPSMRRSWRSGPARGATCSPQSDAPAADTRFAEIFMRELKIYCRKGNRIAEKLSKNEWSVSFSG